MIFLCSLVAADLIYKPYQYYKNISIYGINTEAITMPLNCRKDQTQFSCLNPGLQAFSFQNRTFTIDTSDQKCLDYNVVYNGSFILLKFNLFDNSVTENVYKQGIRVEVKRYGEYKEMDYDNGAFVYKIQTIGKYWEIVEFSARQVYYGNCKIKDYIVQLNLMHYLPLFEKYDDFQSFESGIVNSLLASTEFGNEYIMYSYNATQFTYAADRSYNYQFSFSISKISMGSHYLIIKTINSRCYYYSMTLKYDIPCSDMLLTFAFTFVVQFENTLTLYTLDAPYVIHSSFNGTMLSLNQKYLIVESVQEGKMKYNINSKVWTQTNTTMVSQIGIEESSTYLNSTSITGLFGSVSITDDVQSIQLINRYFYFVSQTFRFGSLDSLDIIDTKLMPSLYACNLLGHCKFYVNSTFIEINLFEFAGLKKYFLLI